MSAYYTCNYSYDNNFMHSYKEIYFKCDQCSEKTLDCTNWIEWVTTASTKTYKQLHFCCFNCYNTYKQQIEDINGKTENK